MSLFTRKSLFFSCKNYSKTCRRNFKILSANSDGSKEFEIPVGWGTVAGKVWGPENGRPVVALHGWLNNANSFDPMIPYLRDDLRIYALDLIGHGKSSHLGYGACYGLDSVTLAAAIAIKKLQLKEKFIFLGHSGGAEVGYLYCAFYPDYVSHFIGFDDINPVLNTSKMVYKKSKIFFDGNIKYEMDDYKIPCYTEEEALSKLIEYNNGSLTPETGKILLKRMLKPSPHGDGYMFNLDHRTKYYIFDYGAAHEKLLYLSQYIKCNYLFIEASDGWWNENNEDPERIKEYLKNHPNYSYVKVEGKHHVHMTDPEKIASICNKFIEGKKL